jgi:hypothetical protein
MKVLREADWEPSLHWKALPIEFEKLFPYYPSSSDMKTLLSEASSVRHVQWE